VFRSLLAVDNQDPNIVVFGSVTRRNANCIQHFNIDRNSARTKKWVEPLLHGPCRGVSI
jgi:hypothetical protein